MLLVFFLQLCVVILKCFICLKDYPFKPQKHHSLDYVRQFPHLRPRTLFFGALTRIRSAATVAVHKYFQVRAIQLINFYSVNSYIVAHITCGCFSAQWNIGKWCFCPFGIGQTVAWGSASNLNAPKGSIPTKRLKNHMKVEILYV